MLQRLFISNFALIERLDITFDNGLQVITGETGAGKSIALGALQLTLGARADGVSLAEPDKKCIVEAVFDIEELHIEHFFKEHDLDYEPITMLRREILPTGRSRAFINDSPVSLQLLKQMGDLLVHIHFQHDTLLLKQADFQQSMFDLIAGNTKTWETYQSLWNEYQKAQKRLESLEKDMVDAQNNADYLNFQIEQWEALAWKPGMLSELEEEQHALQHADLIRQSLLRASEGLQGAEPGILSALHHMQQQLSKLAEFGESFSEMTQRLDSCRLELQDLAMEMDQKGQMVQGDPERLEFLTNKLSSFYDFQRKHRLESEQEVLERVDQWHDQLNTQDGVKAAYESCAAECQRLQLALHKAAEALSADRTQEKPSFQSQVHHYLEALGLQGARIDVELNKLPKPGPFGFEKPQFLFAANPGLPPGPMSQTASGGELSRLMLAIKALAAGKRQMPTLIFDEIDTGISGKVASSMGKLLAGLGKGMQVLAITHLPQIAASGQKHFKVLKAEGKTQMLALNPMERVDEIAGMLSGEKITQEAREQAQKLLKSA